ncbi:MAG TPA: hemolysin [Deltaproteobacteria bacterium]|nr:hemolysin [Deltaproteobacteria bacterium]
MHFIVASGGGMPSLSDIPELVVGFLNPAHPEHLPMLLVYAGGALAISFFCSLLEATLLSVRVTELMRRSEDGEEGVRLLLLYKEERIEDGIGAILTLNTIAHTIGASLAGAQAARTFSSESLPEDVAVAGFSAILTVAVLVATEIIPKTLGTNYASALAPMVGRSIHILSTITRPILFVTGFLTRMLSRGEPEGISRGELQALVNMAQSDGAIQHDESRVLTNLLGFEGLTVSDVMTPRTVLRMLELDSPIGVVVELDVLAAHTRIPVYKESRDQVQGYVHMRELLRALALGKSRDLPLSDFLRPVATMPESTTLGAALRTFLETRDHMAIVQDEFGGTSGLVTLEDVMETLLGAEIVDESDKVADLRALATQIRDQRMARRNHQAEE